MASVDVNDLMVDNLTLHVIKTSMQNVKDERIRELVLELIQHLHDYVRKVKLRPNEWEKAIQYLTKTGQECTPDRQEMILLSDVLGVSSLVDAINSAQARANLATESSVLGPFHSDNTKTLANGQSIESSGVIGELMLIHGIVQSVDGAPIEGVAVDIWETNGNGFYDMQDPNRNEPNCRGIFHTDSYGVFYLIGVRSVDYDIPSDGAVGTLLTLLKRNITRPAHVHFQLKHPSYVDLTTALYSNRSKHIANDPVFGVKKSLVKEFKWDSNPTLLIQKYNLNDSLDYMKWNQEGLWVLEHTFVLLHK